MKEGNEAWVLHMLGQALRGRPVGEVIEPPMLDRKLLGLSFVKREMAFHPMDTQDTPFVAKNVIPQIWVRLKRIGRCLRVS